MLTLKQARKNSINFDISQYKEINIYTSVLGLMHITLLHYRLPESARIITDIQCRLYDEWYCNLTI